MNPTFPLPHAVDNGHVTKFGLTVLTVQQQQTYLEEAKKHIEQKAEASPSAWKRTSAKRPPGFCKSIECRKVSKPAAIFGGAALYHCAECLARVLCNSRLNSEGPQVRIEIVSNSGGSPKCPAKQLLVQFNGEHITINDHRVVAVSWELMENGPEDHIKYKLVIRQDLTIDGQIISGSFSGRIKGRFVCKNVALGRKCLSLEPGYKPKGFMANSVPPGFPGWREEQKADDPLDNGRINTHEWCPACAIQMSQEKRPATPPEIKSPDPQLLAVKKELDQWKNKCSELEQKVETLRQALMEKQKDCSKYCEDLNNRDAENAELRRENAKLKAEKLNNMLRNMDNKK